MHRRPNPLSVVAALLLGGALLAGCTSGASDAEAGSVVGTAHDRGVEESVAEDDGAGLADSAASDQAEADREVITTGSATVVAEDPLAAVEEVASLAESTGGRVESRYQSAADGDAPASAEMTIRVPADRTTATIDALGEVGEVRDLSVEEVDVTGTARDLDARIEALSTSVDRLRTLMGDATTTEDLLAAEQELTSRQADLESLQSQRAALSEQVAMSTLHVSVVAVTPVEQLSPGGFLGGLQNGWNALLSTLNGLVVGLGALLPWLVVAGVVLLVVRWVRRSRRGAAGGGRGTGDDPARPDGPVHPDADGAQEQGVPARGAPPLVGADRD
ncbi:DUF4349 domain-containing protein [Cellulosimicrobium marinum]|uniref:DUF4349 domain-containing protein n=1 Tax=Cellulosimicrobium marinum TaxID=1638992 RepID=UPI001E2F7EC6|nr:DUF4349 domain-containing protein [Cellulosimicrobium marinum]MCB7136434.1 DUF4349 domain-containing protein [Cellulosimicrobium marinum]